MWVSLSGGEYCEWVFTEEEEKKSRICFITFFEFAFFKAN